MTQGGYQIIGLIIFPIESKMAAAKNLALV